MDLALDNLQRLMCNKTKHCQNVEFSLSSENDFSW